MRRKKNDLLYLPWNKIQSATVFNAVFFIISQAYVGTATDDEVSCWAELSSMLPIFILIRGVSELFVTFVKGFLEDKKPCCKESVAWSPAEYSKLQPWMKCAVTKLLCLMEPCLLQKNRDLTAEVKPLLSSSLHFWHNVGNTLFYFNCSENVHPRQEA